VRQELARLRQTGVLTLQERFERAVQEGDLPAGTDCATLARYIATVLNGLAQHDKITIEGPQEAALPPALQTHPPATMVSVD
jgi:hypothetical protein